MYTMDISIDQNDFPNSDAQPNKRRRKKSMVWEHFTIETVDADCIRACCNQCKKSFAYISGSKLAGTSHLKRHIALGICPVSRHNQGKDQPSPYIPAPRTNISANGNFPRKRHRAANGVGSIYISEDNYSHELAKMIIQHEYPLHMVEHSGFIDFARTLQPQFNITSVTPVQEQVMGIYFREKHKLLDLLSGMSGRLNLTVDLWTSNQSIAYVLLTGHFIDNDWKLQRRILNFITVQFPDSDTAFSHAIADCLTDWGAEDKLFTVTSDRSYAKEKNRDNLRNLLSIKNSLILNGQLLINSCYARILRSLAQDAIGSMRETIEKVRQSVKYVKTSDAHEERFTKLKQQLQVPSTKHLMIDNLTNWSSTYQMLMAASELKEVFSCLDTSDPDYKLSPQMEEWEQVETLCAYLKIFYEAANILTSPVYPTTNLFFHEAWKIHLELMHGANSQDFFVSCLTKPLMEKFTKYWDDCNLVLAVAVVMDPRFKMRLVEFSFSRIYGEDVETWINIVDEGLHELYLEYLVQSLPAPTFIEGENDTLVKTEPQEEGLLSNTDGFSDFDIYISDIMSAQHMKSELDQYLEEPLLPRVQDFDVLGWWKMNRSKYPTLSKLASDVLSIPLSTISAESVFDMREKKIDSYRSSLRPSILQALVCSKDWLQHESSEVPLGISTEISAAAVKTEF
ncbi:zinc finger BED domain-containing protein DAYSLEEPER-like isoform X2 [Sesamum indicum]|nr:zinc finger BED domain-containing protein DAYSLEEPER-like isoform X2 [Sesamum indicum]